MKTLIISLDGFKYDYLRNCSFLNSYAKENLLGKVTTEYGFRGIFASAFTGKSQEEHGIFTEFQFKPNSSLKFFSKSFFRNLSRRKLSYLTSLSRKLKGKSFMGKIPENLPLSYLKYFDFSLDKNFFEKDSLRVKTIFDLIRERNKKFIYLHYPVIGFNNKVKYDFFGKNGDKAKCEKIKKYFSKGYDYYFLNLSEPDRVAHKFGIKSFRVKDCLKILDNLIEDLVKSFKGNIVVWSDHGMVDVKKRIDVKERLSNLNLKDGKDYLAFLNSTMVQLWFFNKKAEKLIKEELKDLKFIDKKLAEKYKIRFKDNRYGDLIYFSKGRKVIEPDYFEGKVNAMHGFFPENEDMKTILITNKDKGKKEMNIKELFGFFSSEE